MTPQSPPVEAMIFDVFGTCVDWRTGVADAVRTPLADAGNALGSTVDPLAFADAWRGEYQPAMQRIRAGNRGYVDLDILHRENLDRVLQRLGLDAAFGEASRASMTRAWERLPPWPDVLAGLHDMKRHAIIAPCSNGSIALMTRLARHSGLPWDCILGAAIARDYKPKPEVYRAACAALRLEPGAVVMVAAHNDDLAAARAAGLRTAFVARPGEHGAHQTTDLTAEQDWDYVAPDFNALAAMIALA